MESQDKAKRIGHGDSSTNQWADRLGHALRNLDDRSVLNRSPLARLAYVERLAKERYGDHVLPRGLALRELLIECVDRLANDLHNEPALSPACQYLVLQKEGLNCQRISQKLGLSREHVSRVYRPKALELLAEQFLCVIRNGS